MTHGRNTWLGQGGAICPQEVEQPFEAMWPLDIRWLTLQRCQSPLMFNTSDFWIDFANLPIVTSSVSSLIRRSPPPETGSGGESAAVRVSTRTRNTTLARAKKAKSCYWSQDTSSPQRVCGLPASQIAVVLPSVTMRLVHKHTLHCGAMWGDTAPSAGLCHAYQYLFHFQVATLVRFKRKPASRGIVLCAK